VMEKHRGRVEKEAGITLRMRACSGKPKEDRSGLILPDTEAEEEGPVICSWQCASILRAETSLAARPSRCRACLVELESSGEQRHGEVEVVSSSSFPLGFLAWRGGKKRGRKEGGAEVTRIA
jgi:hypothetical protein